MSEAVFPLAYPTHPGGVDFGRSTPRGGGFVRISRSGQAARMGGIGLAGQMSTWQARRRRPTPKGKPSVGFKATRGA